MVFSVMTGILLPVRLIFVSYVSDNWFGSFGIISIISLSLIILSKKKKLGKFGQMFERQFQRLQNGKKSRFVYGQLVFFLIILGGIIFSIEVGNSEFSALKNELTESNPEITDPEKLIQQTKNISPMELVYGFMLMSVAVFFAFPQIAVVFAILNDTFYGWILHFYTVGFVECAELLGLLLFHRFYHKKSSHKILE